MNWDLIWTVLGLALIVAVFFPIYLVEFAAYQKTKFESMMEVMSNAEKKINDHNFDEALKNMFQEGVENE